LSRVACPKINDQGTSANKNERCTGTSNNEAGAALDLLVGLTAT
jgi:hypothetical protein